MPDVVENAIKPSMRIIRVSKARDERQSAIFHGPSVRGRHPQAMRNPEESVQTPNELRFRALQRASRGSLLGLLCK